LTTAAIYEFQDINARMRMIQREIERDMAMPTVRAEALADMPDYLPTAMVYDFEELASCVYVLEDDRDLSEDALEEIEINLDHTPPSHQPAVFAYADLRNRMAVLDGRAPTNTLYHHPMLSDSDEDKAKYREWAEDYAKDPQARSRGSRHFTMDGWLIRAGHEYDGLTDSCKRCGLSYTDIAELDRRVCNGRVGDELCIQCGKLGFVSLSRTRWGVYRGDGEPRIHKGRCLECGWSTYTDLTNPRDGHRFMPQRKPGKAVFLGGRNMGKTAAAQAVMGDGVALNTSVHPAIIEQERQAKLKAMEAARKAYREQQEITAARLLNQAFDDQIDAVGAMLSGKSTKQLIAEACGQAALDAKQRAVLDAIVNAAHPPLLFTNTVAPGQGNLTEEALMTAMAQIKRDRVAVRTAPKGLMNLLGIKVEVDLAGAEPGDVFEVWSPQYEAIIKDAMQRLVDSHMMGDIGGMAPPSMAYLDELKAAQEDRHAHPDVYLGGPGAVIEAGHGGPGAALVNGPKGPMYAKLPKPDPVGCCNCSNCMAYRADRARIGAGVSRS